MHNPSDPLAGPVSTGADATDRHLILPESPPTFQCSGCGHCCTMWQVFIDQRRGDHLLAQPWVTDRLADHHVSLEPVPGKGYYLPLKADNSCIFLDDAHHCLVDIIEGPGAKPNDCQRFPFAGVPAAVNGQDAPSIEHYDVSAACQTIASKLLLAFAPIQPGGGERHAVEDYVAHTAGLSAFSKKVPQFGPWLRRFPWPLGWWRRLSVTEFEQTLLAVRKGFLVPEVSPIACLRAARARILGRTQPLMSAPHWPRWKTRLLLLMTLRRPYRLYSVWQWLSPGEFRDARILGADVSVPVREVEAVPWPLEVGERHVRAFLFALMSRRIALSYGSAWLTQLSITVAAWALLGWYARLFAHINGAEAVGEADVVLAIRTVERYYTGHQPRFQGLFDWNPVYGWLAVWLL